MKKAHMALALIVTTMVVIIIVVLIGCNTGKRLPTDQNDREAKDGSDSIVLAANPVGPDGQPIIDEQYRLEVLEKHSWVIEGLYFGGPIILYEKSGPRLPMEEIPGGIALEPAAAFYAILTLDFDVSLRDVVEAGLWPYDVFAEESFLDMKLYDFPMQVPVAYGPGFNLAVKENVGSPEWYMRCRNDILQCFYREYYYNNQGLEYEPTNIPGEPYFKFWDFEPLPADSFGLDGKFLGEVTSVPVERFRNAFHAKAPHLDFEVLWIPYISIDKSGSPSTQDNPTTVPSDKIASASADCCLFMARSESYMFGEKGLKQEICCDCNKGTPWCCEWTWDYTGAWGREWYEYVECVDCDTTPLPGYVIRSHGQRAPNTNWGSLGYASNIVKDCDPEILCTLEDPGCRNAMDNFHDALKNGHSASAPGPLCTQCGGS